MKKATEFGLLLLPLLVAVILVFVVNRRHNSAEFLLASYPQNPGFSDYVQSHQNWVVTADSKVILYATWFSDNEGYCAMQCIVDAKGGVLTVRAVYNWAHQNSQNSQMTAAKTIALKSLLKNLPSRSEKPPVNRLLILSFSTGESRATRIYDRSNLPQQIKDVYQLTGAALE